MLVRNHRVHCGPPPWRLCVAHPKFLEVTDHHLRMWKECVNREQCEGRGLGECHLVQGAATTDALAATWVEESILGPAARLDVRRAEKAPPLVIRQFIALH